MKSEDLKKMETALAVALREGTVAIPFMLLTYYSKLQLSDTEAMLLIQLIAFREKENKEFPTIEELQERMSASPEQVIQALQRMLKEGFLTIDEETDPHTGVHFEWYNVSAVFRKLAAVWYAEYERWAADEGGRSHSAPKPSFTDRFYGAQPGWQAEVQPGSQAKAQPGSQTRGNEGKPDLFTVFENEFVRPLTPMECETISSWLDKDRYPEELVLAALKEAVFAGKVHFRYIDRILLDWKRNRVFTVEQAKEYAQRFRGGRL